MLSRHHGSFTIYKNMKYVVWWKLICYMLNILQNKKTPLPAGLITDHRDTMGAERSDCSGGGRVGNSSKEGGVVWSWMELKTQPAECPERQRMGCGRRSASGRPWGFWKMSKACLTMMNSELSRTQGTSHSVHCWWECKQACSDCRATEPKAPKTLKIQTLFGSWLEKIWNGDFWESHDRKISWFS